MKKINVKKIIKISEDKNVINSMNRLVANIKFESMKNNIKSITVVSPEKDEGKTAVAFCLAKTLAQEGNPVVVLDLDIYHKSLTHFLGVKNQQISIYDVFNQRAQIDSVIFRTEWNNLFFLDCTRYINNISEFLGHKKFADFYQWLTANFAYIIIDTPPLLPCVDSSLISNVCDASLICARKNKTTKEALKLCYDQMKASHSRMIGSILTFSEKKDQGYYYY